MTLEEFFVDLKSLPTSWCLVGDTIRTFGGNHKEKLPPLEVMCYAKGGTVSWNPGRLHRPRLVLEFYEHGLLLGLPSTDTHAIFRATDNDIQLAPEWNTLGEEAKENFSKKLALGKDPEKTYTETRNYFVKDYAVRQKLLEVCKPIYKYDERFPKTKNDLATN